jgi:hypothetical protein
MTFLPAEDKDYHMAYETIKVSLRQRSNQKEETQKKFQQNEEKKTSRKHQKQ